MATPLQTRNVIEKKIRIAFRGVVLGEGISLRQAQLTDGSRNAPPGNREITDNWSRVPLGEITDDWSRVPLDELERNCIGHLDALGFRYYIPALMLSVLDHYNPTSMRVIGTLRGLYPQKDGSWEYHMKRYSLLNDAQKSAIAHFLTQVPELVELGLEDQKLVARAVRNYWGKYVEANASGKR